MSQQDPHGRQPTEEELRQLYEEELKRIKVDDVVLQTIVSLVNLGGRRLGLGGSDEAQDLEQVRTAIEAVRALLPVVEPRHSEALGPVRDALSQLQLAYARTAGEAGKPPPAEGESPPPTEDPSAQPGPAQSSGRLWIPGQ